MKFSEKLVEIRKKEKLSQEKFAEILGVTRQTVSNWENYKNYPDISTLIMISNKFNISLDELLKDDKTMINNIDKKIKKNKIFKIIIIILISIIIIYSILFYMFPEIISQNPKNHNRAWITCTKGDEELLYQLGYNKVFKYTLGFNLRIRNMDYIENGGAREEIKYFTDDIRENFWKELTEKNPKNYEEHIRFVKEYFESNGATCKDGYPDWYIGGVIG